MNSVNGKPTLKISENIEKITLPGKKKLYRYLNRDGTFYGDAILLEKETVLERMHHPTFSVHKKDLNGMEYEPLLTTVIANGKEACPLPSVKEIAIYHKERFRKLPREYKRFDNPHIYKVGISTKLMELRDVLMNVYKK